MQRNLLTAVFWLFAILCCHAQKDPCNTVLARNRTRQLSLTLADIDLRQMRPAGNCSLVAEGWIGKRKYLAMGDVQGGITDTLRLPADSTRYQLLPWGQGALRVRIDQLEQGLSFVSYQPRLGDELLKAEARTLSLAAIPGWDILPPTPTQVSEEDAEEYQRLRYQLLAVGAYAQRLTLLVRRVSWPCVPSQAACCGQTPTWTYYFVELRTDGLGLPQADKPRVVKLPQELCPQPPPHCRPDLRLFAEEDLAGTLYDKQPVVYIGAGVWVCNTGKSLVHIGQKATKAIALPKKLRATQVWVEGITSDEEGTVPMLYVRQGGSLLQAEKTKAFELKKQFVIGAIRTIPLSEVAKGHRSNQFFELTSPVQDGLLYAIPLGYMGHSWWLNGKGLPKAIPKKQSSFGE